MYHNKSNDKLCETQTFRVTKLEKQLIQSMSSKMKCSNSEVWRAILNTVAVLYNDNLTLKDAIDDSVMKNKTTFKKMSDEPLNKVIKSVSWLDNWLKSMDYK